MEMKLISGKDNSQGIVSIEFDDGYVRCFDNLGGEYIGNAAHWALYSQNIDNDCIVLKGNGHYKYAKKYESMDQLKTDYSKNVYQKKIDGFCLWSPKEQYMVRHGTTYYKGLTPKDVSVLSFDIETTSLVPSDNDKVLLISNTFRDRHGNIEKRLFCYDDYNSIKEMIYAWTEFLNERGPDIILGHNIFVFDIPYLSYYVNDLHLGRERRPCRFASKPSEFRKEGSQTYTYTNVLAYGREIIDTMHLAYKYDAASRKYESYALKSIIKSEGLEKKDRQFYDASKIRTNYQNPVEWEKIKAYAIDDADDALVLFDLMIPAYFYLTQSVPKTLQQVVNGASGSQINSWMLRAYLQDGYSIPKASETFHFEGAISFGNAGIYQNVSKVDVASLYPSIIIQENVYDKSKDPNGYFLEMVRFFTRERLNNKSLAAKLGDKKYKDLEQAQKIFINSAYGFMGANGLNFNSPNCAAFITKTGRNILQKGMDWASKRGYTVVNGDTDSFCYLGSKDFKEEIESLNKEFPSQIKWTNDGQYKGMIIVKAKNYAMLTDKGIKIKGSGLKASMKESALRDFMNQVLVCLLEGRQNDVYRLYNSCAADIANINKDTIENWASKKTVTKAVLEPKRTNESRVLDAIQGKGFNEGDKFYVFFKSETELCCVEDFDGIYDKGTLYEKLFKTIKIFDPVLDISQFPNYSLKRNQDRIPRSAEIFYSKEVEPVSKTISAVSTS
jgi:DNA polymerase elongation subunit (family B)